MLARAQAAQSRIRRAFSGVLRSSSSSAWQAPWVAQSSRGR